MNLDKYPGQERGLLLGVRLGLAVLVGVVIGALLVERVVDPWAILVGGVAAYGLWTLRRF